MTAHILQINLIHNLNSKELETAFIPGADAISSFPGLRWKIWISNNDLKTAGGIYCFESEEALASYLDSPIISALKSKPFVQDIEIKSFHVLTELTSVTRGPIV
jgi:hypothetical protein